MENKKVAFQLDTGASINILPANYFKRKLNLTPTKTGLRVWNQTTMLSLRKSVIELQNPKNMEKCKVEFVIVPENKNLVPLLGCNAIQKMNLITVNVDNFRGISGPVINVVSQQLTEEILKEHIEIFDGSLGRLPGNKIHLEIEKDAQPSITPTRSIPIPIREMVKKNWTNLMIAEYWPKLTASQIGFRQWSYQKRRILMT